MKSELAIFSGRLTSDLFWLASGQAMVAIAMLLGVRIITELVSPAVYGQISLLMGIALLGRQTFAFPYLQAGLRFYPEAVVSKQVGILRKIISWNLFKTSGVCIMLLLFGGAVYVSLYKNIPFGFFAIIAGILAADIYLTLDTDFYNAARLHRHFVIIVAGNAWLRPAVAVLVVMFLGPTAGSVLGGYFMATLFVLAIIYIFPVKRVGVFSENENKADLRLFSKQIHKYAIPLIPLAIVGWVSSLSDRYFIAALIDIKSVGIYAGAYNLMSMPFTMFQAVIERALRPVYFDAVSKGDTAMAKRYYSIWLASVFGTCTIGVILAFLFSSFIVQVCLASEYRSSAAFMPWIALGHLFLVMSTVFETKCLAHKKSQYVLIIQALGAIFSIITVIPLIKGYGLLGAAWAVPIYFGLRLLVAIGYFLKLID